MTGTVRRFTGAPFSGMISWRSIDWKAVEASVRRMQVRIAKAVREGRFGKAKAIQWLLTHSFHANTIAWEVQPGRPARTGL